MLLFVKQDNGDWLLISKAAEELDTNQEKSDEETVTWSESKEPFGSLIPKGFLTAKKRAHNLNRLGLLDSSPDPLHARLLLHWVLYHIFSVCRAFSHHFSKLAWHPDSGLLNWNHHIYSEVRSHEQLEVPPVTVESFKKENQTQPKSVRLGHLCDSWITRTLCTYLVDF